MKPWDYPYDVQYLDLDSKLNIAYIDEGKGPRTLLFIHGMGNYLMGWHKTISFLKEHFRCIAIDLPGYGKSSKASYPFSLDFFANTINRFIDKIGLSQLTLFGHSMGGQIAFRIAHLYQNKIDKLILVAPAGFETFLPHEKQMLLQLTSPEILMNLKADQIFENFNINFFDMPADAHFMIDDRLALRKTVQYEYFCRLVPACINSMLSTPIFDDLPDMNLPTLIVFGIQDMLIPNQLFHGHLSTRDIAFAGHQRLPNSELELVDHAGHFVHWEQSASVNQRIFAFLQS